MKLFKLFAGHLPDRQHFLGVYAVIVVLVYSWTLFTSFYKLPSWMFYLTIGQILSVYAYAFLAGLLESILVLTGVLLLHFTLFLALKNKEEFQSRSILTVLVVLFSSLFRLISFPGYEDMQLFLNGELTWWVITLPLGLAFAVIASKSEWVRKILDSVAERAVIFLYIYLPLSLISLMVLFFRNI